MYIKTEMQNILCSKVKSFDSYQQLFVISYLLYFFTKFFIITKKYFELHKVNETDLIFTRLL